MSYEERDAYGMYVDRGHKGPGPELMGADTLIGDHVHNAKDEHLGEIKEIMIDMRSGKIAYAVMSHGGVFTIGEKLFAVPWEALLLDTVNKRFTLNIDEAQAIKNGATKRSQAVMALKGDFRMIATGTPAPPVISFTRSTKFSVL